MRCWALLLLLLVALLNPQPSCGETWAERLGYPPEKKILILHANRMGLAYEFNRPAQELMTAGLVQSASVLVPCPWFQQFASWCREHPGQDVGISLSLNSPHAGYRWRPATPQGSVSSLVDSDGYLLRTVLQTTLRAEVDDVQRELRSQIALARAAGIRPTHLHTHLGGMLARTDLTKVYLDLAEECWLPAVMVELTPELVERLRKEGFPMTPEMIELVADYPLPKLDDIHVVPHAESYDEKRDAFFELIRNLSPGLTQIFVSPAEASEALAWVADRPQDHVWENRLLQDPKVHAFLEQQEIELTSWLEIMHRFENEQAISGSPENAESHESSPPQGVTTE